MAGTSGASTVVREGNEGEKCKEDKRMKCEEGDDDNLISALPDCLIEHILSLLPSTKDAIRTGVLSKRWLHQWTHVPVLIFKSEDGMPIQNFSNFIDDALNLYYCSKIKKFVIDSYDTLLNELGRKLDMFIRFAAARDAKELILDCIPAAVEYYEEDDDYYKYELPQFLFKCAFLVKLRTYSCVFRPAKGKVNWASLKALHIGFSYISNQGIGNVLFGSPLIEYLELCHCHGFERLVIASKSLKTFRMSDSKCSAIEISCPNLEKLELLGEMTFTRLEPKELPSSICAVLDFETGGYHCSADDKLKLVKEFLLQVQHVEEIKLGPWFLMSLSLAAVRGETSLLLKNKCLTVMDTFMERRQPALAILLLSCSLLEKLVIHLDGGKSIQLEGFAYVEKDFWELDGSIFMSHLKTVEIVDIQNNDVLKFVEFLLKNARMLEKIVLLVAYGRGTTFARKVFRKLSCIRKASPHAIIKVECLSRVVFHHHSDWDKIVC